MKKIRTLLIALSLGLVACGGGPTAEEKAELERQKAQIPKAVVENAEGVTITLTQLHRGNLGWGIYSFELDNRKIVYIIDSDGAAITSYPINSETSSSDF